jgi:two-component system, cell cycle response regulator
VTCTPCAIACSEWSAAFRATAAPTGGHFPVRTGNFPGRQMALPSGCGAREVAVCSLGPSGDRDRERKRGAWQCVVGAGTWCASDRRRMVRTSDQRERTGTGRTSGDVEAERTASVPGQRGSETGAQIKRPYLVVIAGTHVGEVHGITKRRTIIGRGPVADIRLMDEGLSRAHTEILVRGPEVSARDLGSLNGTFHNGRRTALCTLADGDKLAIGTTTILRFSFQDELDEAFQRDLYASAVRDSLTQALRKEFFVERLYAEVSFSLRHAVPMALIFWDLDDFKQLNDHYGHPAGDLVLGTVSRAVGQVIRCEDVFGRWGGEEFALICRGATPQEAYRTAERLRGVIASTPVPLGPTSVSVRASFGVAIFPAPGVADASDLLLAADTAMYRAKRAGKNRTEGPA